VYKVFPVVRYGTNNEANYSSCNACRNMWQNVQEPEQLDASPSGNMTTMRAAAHGANPASDDNAFCVSDTPHGTVVLAGIDNGNACLCPA
jgi:hypothetical protein